MRSHISALLPILLLSLAEPRVAYAVDLNKYPKLVTFIDEMVERHGFSQKELRRLFTRAKIRREIIEAIERPKESLPWYEYKKIFITERSVQRGKRYWKKHAQALTRAQEEYGVAPEIIVAILGVETQYGRNKGTYRVIDAFTTLILEYPPRRDFFRRELEEYLLLARELKVDPMYIKGSYAGAVGVPQFIPSSYRQYAVDFDGDQKRDLLANADDAIGSVANFLKIHGWEANEPVSDDVQLEGTLYVWIEKLGVKPMLSVRHLINYGIFPRNREDTEKHAALIVLEGESGPIYRIGYNNFYVITRYNRSTRYAMAVYELGKRIRKQHEGES